MGQRSGRTPVCCHIEGDPGERSTFCSGYPRPPLRAVGWRGGGDGSLVGRTGDDSGFGNSAREGEGGCGRRRMELGVEAGDEDAGCR